MTFDKNLGRAAADLRASEIRSGMPTGLHTRILAAIPKLSMGGRGRVLGPPRWIAVAAVIGVVGATGAYRYNVLHRHAKSLADPSSTLIVGLTDPGDPTVEIRNKVRNAVDQANTVHLVLPKFQNPLGTRLITISNQADGPVEIWQRKKPFFYREERAGEILLDDGSNVYHFIPGLTLADAYREENAKERQIVGPKWINKTHFWEGMERALASEVRPPILQVRPSTGNTPITNAISQFEPARLLLGTDRAAKAPSITPWATFYQQGVRTTVDIGHKPTVAEQQVSTSTLSIDRRSKGADEVRIIDSYSYIDSRHPRTDSDNYQTRLVVDSKSFLPKGMTATRWIENTVPGGPVPIYSPNNAITGLPTTIVTRAPLDRPKAVECNVVVADYGVTIPPRLLTLPVAPDTMRVEITGGRALPNLVVPQIGNFKGSALGEIGNFKGLALRALVTDCDAAENVKFTLRWSLNGKTSNYDELGKLLYMRLQSLSISTTDGKCCVSTVDPATKIWQDFISIAAPLEPYGDSASAPKEFVGTAYVVVNGNGFGASIDYDAGTYIVAVPFTIDLQRHGIPSKKTSGLTDAIVDPITAMRVAAARADFYLDRINSESSPAADSTARPKSGTNPMSLSPVDFDKKRAVYWTNTAIADANAAGKNGDAKAYAWHFKSLASQRRRPATVTQGGEIVTH